MAFPLLSELIFYIVKRGKNCLLPLLLYYFVISLMLQCHSWWWYKLIWGNVCVHILVLIKMVVTSPKWYMGAHTLCNAPNQTQLAVPAYSSNWCKLATKQTDCHLVPIPKLQPNTPRWMVSACITPPRTSPPSQIPYPEATNHALWCWPNTCEGDLKLL